ncbi:hypothetical protein M0802_014122 [Mischocyttarus mexicanus]|nr:hypothetical protein M0802_014122 [Mischocyttarus mexicanus]
MMGVRTELTAEEEEGEERQTEGLMTREIKVGEERWVVVAVYVNGDMDRKLEQIREWMEGKGREGRVIIGGDFNARTGERGGSVFGSEEEGVLGGRRSKDKKVNREGLKLTKVLGEVGWGILNGGIKGDEESEYTFTGGKASTVIDYVLADEVSRKEIESMIVEDRVESDHHPLVVTVRGVGRGVGRRQRRGKGGGSRGRWSEKMKEEFCRGMSEVELVQEDVQERVKELTVRVMEEIRRNSNWLRRALGDRPRDLSSSTAESSVCFNVKPRGTRISMSLRSPRKNWLRTSSSTVLNIRSGTSP